MLLFVPLVAEYGVCENLRKLEITGVSCRDVYAKRKWRSQRRFVCCSSCVESLLEVNSHQIL